jgi:hypothetical protein
MDLCIHAFVIFASFLHSEYDPNYGRSDSFQILRIQYPTILTLSLCHAILGASLNSNRGLPAGTRGKCRLMRCDAVWLL